MKDRRPLIVFAIFLIVMAGILITTRHSSGTATNNGPSTDQTTSTTTADETTTTTAKSETTSPTPTTVVNAGPDQWRSIFDYTIGVQNAAFQNPDPSKVDLIMDPACNCYSQTRTGLQSLADKKWHVKGDTLRTNTVALISKSDTQLRITVTFVGTGSPTVDQNGTVKEQGSTGLREPILYVLKKSTNGKWLIVDRHNYEEG
jgi:hypothetical protein